MRPHSTPQQAPLTAPPPALAPPGARRQRPAPHQVWEGKGVVATGRKMIGATNPLASEPGTIRGDFAVEVGGGPCVRMHMHMRTVPPRHD